MEGDSAQLVSKTDPTFQNVQNYNLHLIISSKEERRFGCAHFHFRNESKNRATTTDGAPVFIHRAEPSKTVENVDEIAPLFAILRMNEPSRGEECKTKNSTTLHSFRTAHDLQPRQSFRSPEHNVYENRRLFKNFSKESAKRKTSRRGETRKGIEKM